MTCATGTTPRILIIAGSDSGGGAGIQADIKTVTMLGGHAMTAVTAITAQNTIGVQAVHAVPTDMVVAQMRSCIDDIGVDAVKIGMIGSAETAHAVADVLEGLPRTLRHPGLVPGSTVPQAAVSQAEGWTPAQGRGDGKSVPIVFDPVMVATSGAVLADADTIAAFERLMALATVVTPNTRELTRLSGIKVVDEISQSDAAEAVMLRSGCKAVLAKGGHLREGGHTYGTDAEGKSVVSMNTARVFDYLYELDDGEWREWEWSNHRLNTLHTHGTGCTLATAVATGLGTGLDLPTAIKRAIAFVHTSLEHAPGLGKGHGPMGQQFATGFACPT